MNKKLLIILFILLGILIYSSCTSEKDEIIKKINDEVNNVIVYNENGSLELNIGEYTIAETGKIASADIPDGLRLKLYRDENLGGGYLGLEENQSDLTQSGWYDNIVKIIVEEYIDDEPLVKNYNYVLGTQTFDPLYGFKYKDRTYEAAEEIYKMGSNVLKTFDKNYKPILEDIDFMYIYLWVHSDPVWKYGGMPESKIQKIYDEMYQFVKDILIDYNNTGKSFYIGHWEGDWYLLEGFDSSKQKVGEHNIDGMTIWLNTRQKAIEDAKRDTPHENIYVWGYAEANRVTDIYRDNSERVINSVLPNLNYLDYLSYSAYDIQGLSGEKIKEYIDYMDSMIPREKERERPKFTFVGETGAPAHLCGYNQERHNKENLEIFIKFFDAGINQILYWEMYSNEQFDDSTNKGFWLIDDTGAKWKLYYSFKAFYCNAKEYVRDYIKTNGTTPNTPEFNKWAAAFLRTLTVIQNESTEIFSAQIINLDEKTTKITKKNGEIVLPMIIPVTDMTLLEKDTAYIEYKLHINDIDLFTQLSFEITSAKMPDKQEYQWNITGKNLKTGWNIIRHSINDSPPDITEGEPDLTKVNFIRWD